MTNQGQPPQLKRLRDDTLLPIRNAAIAGRHSSCDISLANEQGASRKHARFTIDEGIVSISDLGSLNGTLINGVELEGKQTLRDGDILIFDTDKYLVKIPKKLKQAKPQPAAHNADTVIANKLERADPSSIKPAIKVLPNESTDPIAPPPQNRRSGNAQEMLSDSWHDAPSGSTVEYINSLPNPDMKRPVGMPVLTASRRNSNLITRILIIVALVAVVFMAYQFGLRASS